MFNATLIKLYRTSIILALISIVFYFSFAYDLHRSDYFKLITLYSALFFLFYKLIQINKGDYKFLVFISFLFRAIFLFAIPNLSQDFYRFIWDGRMILEGFNPYLYTPESFICNNELPVLQAQELYNGMGVLNGSHFTNYPPINQLCFYIAALFTGKSIIGSAIVFRLIIIVADFGTLYFGKKLLEKLNLPIHNIFWYILNPFIIIELTGNLHFEAVMIFFLIWSLYLLHCNKWKLAAVIFALSVSIKLIPLIFLPLFYQWFTSTNTMSTLKNHKQKSTTVIARSIRHGNISNRNRLLHFIRNDVSKLILFYAIICFTTLILFLPFYSSTFLTNYTQTVGLWFQNFEFNASFYYVFREIGYLFRGWNEITIIGKIIPILIILFVLFITFFRNNKTTIQLITSMLFALSFYYFTSTTVHPWYIATLLILSVFTNYKFPLVWSFIIIISYLAYANTDKSENLWIITLEYMLVYTVLLYELFIKNNSLEHQL